VFAEQRHERAAAPRVVALLGFGEAGTEIGRDLVRAGATVRGYDPVAPAPDGVSSANSDAEACAGAELILSLTTAHESQAALEQALPGIAPGALFADLNTASSGLKRSLAERAATAGVAFADVAMMAPVPGRGIRTPMLVSGAAAPAVVAALNVLGADAELLPGDAGAAAQRKLLRSVFYKGMAAAVLEALTAARAAGCEEWLREHIESELAAADRTTVDRLENGSRTHAVRRADEMAAATALLGELGTPHRVAAASRDWLVELAHQAEGRR
jgi:3-hydroxyisobutyrate dehydrogenase-like beta-hydroxyacid dehydrogenase